MVKGVVASNKVLDALKAIGLNKYERNLWAALLSRGSSTAGELSDISNVPRSRCYDVLESLADRGFVVIQPGKPMKYVAVHPKEALERAKKKYYEEAEDMAKRIDRMRKSSAVRELEKLHKDTIKTVKPEDLTGALKGRYAMTQQLETMFKNAKKSIQMMTTEGDLIHIAENHGNVLKKASDSGVKIQIATHVTKQNGDAVKSLAKFADMKSISDVEHASEMLPRIYMVDGGELVMGLTDDKKTHHTQDVAFWTQSDHATTNMLRPMFNMVWKQGKSVK